ncbi:MAG: glycoside hydrolase family 92 protein [Barnesiella sp.]|nr:glycoside hydrolase family 92 protein [Barnesiella sp.]
MKAKIKTDVVRLGVATLILSAVSVGSIGAANTPVDYVNPYIGNISHMLMPTFPTVHLPNGMMRVYPERGSFTDSRVNGLPLFVVNHRECKAFNLSASQSIAPGSEIPYSIVTDYDNETITPYSYTTDIDGQNIRAEYTPSRHSALYRLTPDASQSGDMTVILNARNGEMNIDGRAMSGFQYSWGGIKVYIYAEADRDPLSAGVLSQGAVSTATSGTGDEACAVMTFDSSAPVVIRYGVSYIDADQARRNMQSEIAGLDFDKAVKQARKAWNDELGKITVEGGTEADKEVFYTALYRCYERPVDLGEQGRYFNPADRKVYDGDHHYTDDWLWDTYRATHPLRILLSESQEADMINSLIDYARHSSGQPWLPTFPAVSGDSHRMNCNHGVAVVADALVKGVKGVDYADAYRYGKAAIEDKTLAPWRNSRAGYLNKFYRDHGYIPALHPGERETLDEVDGWEKRQAVAVTLGTSYDDWCLSVIADRLGLADEAAYYAAQSKNYRNLFNPATSFFHPKDSAGRFIEPFDYRFSGGIGARDYYDENNGWTYRWDCQHDIPGLIELMGGDERFTSNLDDTFNEWLGKNKYEFYSVLPDQTGNVGQFTMGNEPSMHIPYLYNYAHAPWRTQRRVRQLIRQWFRPDVMGVPGDEDGGGLSSFVVFSMMGFYPVTPGSDLYTIGTPFFDKVKLRMENGRELVIEAPGTSDDCKYIVDATLSGKKLDKPFFTHDDIRNGAVIKLKMSPRHSTWGCNPIRN